MNRRLLRTLLAGLLASAAMTASAAVLPFTSSSYDAIRTAHRGSPFLLVLWSVDCPPCVKELGILADALKKHPAMKLVLVSTDELANRPKVEELLTLYGLHQTESWIFGDGEARRLRQRIDANWYGELPRSYFHDAKHRRVSLRAGITADHLDAWLKSIQP